MNLVIDLETTIRCPVGNSSGNPMWRGNKVIAVGMQEIGVGDVKIYRTNISNNSWNRF